MTSIENNEVLEHLGIIVPLSENEIILDHNDQKKDYLPALPTSVAAAMRLFMSVIDIAAIIDPLYKRDPEAARKKIYDRVVRSSADRSPIVASLAFEARILRDKDEKIIDYTVATTFYLPGVGEIEIQPLMYIGVEYVVKKMNIFESNGVFPCLIFKPRTQQENVYKAIPLGIADISVINTWNRIATDPAMKNREWPTISVIKTFLRQPSIRTIIFQPQRLVTQFRHKKDRCIGSRFGQKVFLTHDSQIPEFNEKEFKNFLFRVIPREDDLEVALLGNPDEIKIDYRQFDLRFEDKIRPFELLGTTPNKVNTKTIERVAKGYLNRFFDQKNPLYQGALEFGLIEKTDDEQVVRAILENLMNQAVLQIRTMMIDAYNYLVKQISIAPNKPKPEVVLGGNSFNLVLKKVNEPTDACAVFIEQFLENQKFDPNCPFHMDVRAWLVSEIVPLHLREFPVVKDSIPVSIFSPPPLPVVRPSATSAPILVVAGRVAPLENVVGEEDLGFDDSDQTSVMNIGSDNQLELPIEPERTPIPDLPPKPLSKLPSVSIRDREAIARATTIIIPKAEMPPPMPGAPYYGAFDHLKDGEHSDH